MFIFRLSLQPALLRRGMAPLEFVMALPVLLLLMVAITWLGFSVVGQSRVLTEARNKAWKRRFEDASKKPLIFTATPLYNKGADYAVENAKGKVEVSPLFDKLPDPEASHTVLAGSWDHTALPMNGPPNWKLHAIAVANAKSAGLQSAVGNLENIGSLVGDIAASAIAQAASEALGGGSGGGGIDDLGGAIDSQVPKTEGEEANQNAEREAKKRELTQRRTAIDQEITKAEQELEKLRKEQQLPLPGGNNPPPANPPAGNPPADDKDKDKTPAAKRREQQIELLETTLKRLESERKDVEAELEGAE